MTQPSERGRLDYLPQHLEVRCGALWQAVVERSCVAYAEEQDEVHGLSVVELPGLRRKARSPVGPTGVSVARSSVNRRRRTFHCFFSSLAICFFPETLSPRASTPMCIAWQKLRYCMHRRGVRHPEEQEQLIEREAGGDCSP